MRKMLSALASDLLREITEGDGEDSGLWLGQIEALTKKLRTDFYELLDARNELVSGHYVRWNGPFLLVPTKPDCPFYAGNRPADATTFCSCEKL